MDSYRGEFALAHPVFPKGSEAEALESGKPVDANTPRINYTAEDDKAIDDYHRANGMLSIILCP
jgi:alcohol oxidase